MQNYLLQKVSKSRTDLKGGMSAIDDMEAVQRRWRRRALLVGISDSMQSLESNTKAMNGIVNKLGENEEMVKTLEMVNALRQNSTRRSPKSKRVSFRSVSFEISS